MPAAVERHGRRSEERPGRSGCFREGTAGVGALVTRGVPGSDLNTERVSEGAKYVGGGVHEGDVVENSRVGGLPEGDLDVGELSVDEELLAAVAAASASSKDGELGTTPTHR